MARTPRNPDRPPPPPPQHERGSETPEKKLAVVNYFRAHGIARTMDEFYAHYTERRARSKKKQVYKWNKLRREIEEWCSNAVTAKKLKQRPRGAGTALTPANELRIVAWSNTLRVEGIPVSAQMLKLKALEIASEQGVPRNHFGRIVPADMDETAVAFVAAVLAATAELGVTRIYNADQTGINFEYLPKQTVNARGAGTVWFRCGGKDKERATGVFLADSDGNKYVPTLVLKTAPSTVEATRELNDAIRHGFGPRVWESVEYLQKAHNVETHGNATAWWNADLSIEFLDFHFAGREDPEPVLLLWDDFSGHWTEEVEHYALHLNVYLIKVPPGLTGVCQPADVAWFRPYKNHLRSAWVVFLRQQLCDHAARGDGTSSRLRAPNRVDVVAWIRSGWDKLSPAVIKSGFSMYTSSNAQRVEDSTPDYNDVIEQLEGHEATEGTIADDEDIDARVDLVEPEQANMWV